MNNNAAQAVLEEVLLLAMEEALVLKAQKSLSDEDQGALIAYFNLLEFGKQQAATLKVSFDDRELSDFDPYSLIGQQAD
jgi:hypothetical protein